jgi:KDO2-lipid IV(A) lauroyltransferase
MNRRGKVITPLILDWLIAVATLLLFALLRLIPSSRRSDFAACMARRIGPMLPHSRTARENLSRAYPTMPETDQNEILLGMWDNLARTLSEYTDLERLLDFDPARPSIGNLDIVGVEHFLKIRDGSRPAIVFTAHLANWEILSLLAARLGIGVSSLYRRPNNRFVARRLIQLRAARMGRFVESGRGAAFQLAAELERGGRVGLLVDQRFHGGVPARFFGRLADTNPLLAKLARQYDCAVFGARVIRLPGQRFRVEITDEIELPRNADGHIDIDQTTAKITQIVECWIREHPEQWLWLHRRWRLGPRSRIPFLRMLTQRAGSKYPHATR